MQACTVFLWLFMHTCSCLHMYMCTCRHIAGMHMLMHMHACDPRLLFQCHEHSGAHACAELPAAALMQTRVMLLHQVLDLAADQSQPYLAHVHAHAVVFVMPYPTSSMMTAHAKLPVQRRTATEPS